MSSVFSHAGWHPNERHVDSGTAFFGKDAPLTAAEVGVVYRRARFVPSPPGNSPDCFRHYEAVVSGAVPLLDGRPTDFAWWMHYYSSHSFNSYNSLDSNSPSSPESDEAVEVGVDGEVEVEAAAEAEEEEADPANRCIVGESTTALAFPAPLGFIFAETNHPNGSRAETDEERAARDRLGFDRQGYTLLRKASADANDSDDSDDGNGDGGGPAQERSPRYHAHSLAHEIRWRAALRRAKAMGDEEVALRRSLNARWYVSAISDVRTKVQAALAG